MLILQVFLNKLLTLTAHPLIALGINIRTPLNENLTYAELEDIGSTSRGTNLNDTYDFDFTCKLIENDLQRFPEIEQKMLAYFRPESAQSYDKEGNKQLRLFGVKINGQSFDIDIGFSNKKRPRCF